MGIYFEINAAGWLWFFLGVLLTSLLVRFDPGDGEEEAEEPIRHWRDEMMRAKQSIGLAGHGSEQKKEDAIGILDEAELIAHEILTGTAERYNKRGPKLNTPRTEVKGDDMDADGVWSLDGYLGKKDDPFATPFERWKETAHK